MKVRLSIDKVAALKSGLDTHGDVVVEVPAASLTPAQRDELAHWHDSKADFYLPPGGAPPLAKAGPDDVPRLLDIMAASRKKDDDRKAAEHEARVAAWLSKPVEGFTFEYHGSLRLRERHDATLYAIPTDLRLDARVAEAQAWVAKEKERRALKQQELERREEEEKAAAEAKKAAGEAALRSWAETHGSDLLKSRLAEGFEWRKLARVEFCHSIIRQMGLDPDDADTNPEGYERHETMDRTTPTLPEIEYLRDTRARAAALPAELELNWVKYVTDDVGEEFERTELRVTVTAPGGERRCFDFTV